MPYNQQFVHAALVNCPSRRSMVDYQGMNVFTRDLSSDRAVLPVQAAADALQISPEIDWQPDLLAPSAWLEHVPFAFWIMKVLRPAQFVELGTMRGVSYAAFCQAVERLALPTRCYAVD